MVSIYYDKENKKLIARCIECGKEVTMDCTPRQMKRFESGELIQNVFPDESPDNREAFISGICGECWDKMFADYAEDDE